MSEDTPPSGMTSETQLTLVTSFGAVLTAYLSHIDGAATWIALGVCVFLTAAHAFRSTALAAPGGPGIKTKAFWSAVVVVVASVATAIAETDIAGIPAKVTQAAGLVAAAATAFGYRIWRYGKKVHGPVE